MLSPDDAKQIAEVAAGTPVGELLRRYWMPVAAVSELERQPVMPVRVFGEDLVVYKDLAGQYGLLDRRCPHRRFDLAFGTPESCGLRCSYHGWRFDHTGQCIEQPFEDVQASSTAFRDATATTSYPVQSCGGLIWGYFGPQPAPLLPDWAGFHIPGYTVVSFMHVPCNWVQIMEGLHDPVHVEWLHDRWSYRLHGHEVPESRPRHTAFRWIDFEYGVVYQRQFEGSDQWHADRTVIFPNIDGAGGQGTSLTWLVPMDELNTMVVYRVAITNWKTPFGQVVISPKAGFEQTEIPCHRTKAAYDAVEGAGKDTGSHLVSQDALAWMSLGPLVDRTRERLSATDAGIIMFRKKLLEQARLVAGGGDPMGTIRDPARNRRITLPGARKNYGLQAEGLPGMVGDDDISLRAFLPFDLPEDIKASIDEAMSKLVADRRPGWWGKRRPPGA
ncbi:MAG: Rieske 2Fe-2S domain-containing protein [Vicinamibacterales bacterium]